MIERDNCDFQENYSLKEVFEELQNLPTRPNYWLKRLISWNFHEFYSRCLIKFSFACILSLFLCKWNCVLRRHYQFDEHYSDCVRFQPSSTDVKLQSHGENSSVMLVDAVAAHPKSERLNRLLHAILCLSPTFEFFIKLSYAFHS